MGAARYTTHLIAAVAVGRGAEVRAFDVDRRTGQRGTRTVLHGALKHPALRGKWSVTYGAGRDRSRRAGWRDGGRGGKATGRIMIVVVDYTTSVSAPSRLSRLSRHPAIPPSRHPAIFTPIFPYELTIPTFSLTIRLPWPPPLPSTPSSPNHRFLRRVRRVRAPICWLRLSGLVGLPLVN